MCTQEAQQDSNALTTPKDSRDTIDKVRKLFQLEVLMDRFIHAQDVKPSSRNTYRKSIKMFFDWIEENEITAISHSDILDYKRSLEYSDLSPLTISGYLVVVRKFFEWTEAEKLYPNIAKGIKSPRRTKGFKKDCLTPNQAKQLLLIVDRLTAKGKRDFAILNLLIRTGLRTIEIVLANVGDIRQDGGEALLWIQGKGHGDKDDFVLLTPASLNPIHRYLSARGPMKDSDPLFSSLSNRNKNERLTTASVSRLIKKYLRKMGLDSTRLTAHSLRHTAITLSLKGGATIQEAQAFARHSNINTTMVYAHNVNRIENAAERKIDRVL